MFTTSPARRAAIVCAVLCLLFAVLSFSAARQKSATYDEPLHVATGWLNLWQADFRLSPDVPPLWEYWIALPLGRDAMDFDATPDKESLDRRAVSAFYQSPPAAGVELVNRSRWMSLPLAIILLALVAIWAGQLSGPMAAIAATFVFVFDPNWLGHAALAKNDVAFGMVYFATAYAIWRVFALTPSPCTQGGGGGSFLSTNPRSIAMQSQKNPHPNPPPEYRERGLMLAIVILPAVCIGTKLSGLIVVPVMVLTLLSGLLIQDRWRIPRNRWTVIALLISAAIFAYASLWAQYDFRFNAGPDGKQLDVPSMVRDLRDAQVRSEYQVNQPTAEELAAWRPSLDTQFILWLADHRLVPQAWAAGYIYTQTSARERTAYLLGDVYPGGRISYFPLAWLFKEPIALIVAAIASAIILLRHPRWNWNTAALVIPSSIYLLMALRGNVNIGLRHIFPVIPFMDIMMGLAAAKVWSAVHARGLARSVVCILALGLAAETLAVYPDFISFFNVVAGGERGGIALLGDSNLDWGQDLPKLAQWQRQHPDTTLYLDYFGVCNPAAYGIRYLNVPGGYVYGPPPRPGGAGVAAISATKLQRLFVADPEHDFATPFEHAQPFAVLGGTIYLFNVGPKTGG